MKRLPHKNRGFTLIETLVAIAIFAFSITALISITATGVFNTNFVKNKFTASYLAMEGAELVRSVRDSASSSGLSWNNIMQNSGYLANCYDGNACFIDSEHNVSQVSPQLCSGPCPYLSYNRSNGEFSYDQVDQINIFQSIFVRTITITPVSSDEATVVSTVEWTQGGEIKKVEFEYNVLNWIN